MINACIPHEQVYCFKSTEKVWCSPPMKTSWNTRWKLSNVRERRASTLENKRCNASSCCSVGCDWSRYPKNAYYWLLYLSVTVFVFPIGGQ